MNSVNYKNVCNLTYMFVQVYLVKSYIFQDANLNLFY